MKRLGRYLKKVPRVVWKFKWQTPMDEVHVYTDSDWAGCRRTRKNTRGGVVMIGEHVIKSWSRTQKAITLSSGEAELVALVAGMSEGLGIRALGVDRGIERKVIGMCDSSAAMGVVERRGVGKIRHLDVGKLWIQEMRENGGVEIKKVKGTANPADQLTKNLMPQEVVNGAGTMRDGGERRKK